MIVPNIEIVTFLVIIFFGLPIIWSARKNELFKSFNFVGLVKAINKSLMVQGIIGLFLILMTWIWNSADFKYDSLIVGTTYTYVVIGLFMYLPALGILNLIKLIIENKLKNEKVE
ncbi:MAG: hypothetical protein NXH86_03045 [Flavobacteriaceae bacterium]|jgi:hypothetical protein|uniref:hypothetical protein n=1 Tax=Flagellimonas TaxID=444459 RepID=UPI000E2395C1|nr:hypothetical protein [Flavobacteriaceae bacterium]